MATKSYRERIKAIELLLPEFYGAGITFDPNVMQVVLRWRNELLDYQQRQKSGKLRPTQKPQRQRSRRQRPVCDR